MFPTGTSARGFSQSKTSGLGVDSSWTETPQQRAEAARVAHGKRLLEDEANIKLKVSLWTGRFSW